jgi:hypothetical protein
MGMHPMRDPERCPKCGRYLHIPPDPTHPTAPGFPDGVAFGEDPVCGGRWHVWDKTSPHRREARKYVDGEA